MKVIKYFSSFCIIFFYITPIYAFDETLLSCNLVTQASNVSENGGRINLPNANVTVSIRTTNNNIAVMISGEKNPYGGGGLIIMGFNSDTGEYLVEGENLSNDKNYILNQNVIVKRTKKLQGFHSVQINRVTGDIMIMVKGENTIKTSNGKCTKLDSNTKF
jgi:hypothetical protein